MAYFERKIRLHDLNLQLTEQICLYSSAQWGV